MKNWENETPKSCSRIAIEISMLWNELVVIWSYYLFVKISCWSWMYWMNHLKLICNKLHNNLVSIILFIIWNFLSFQWIWFQFPLKQHDIFVPDKLPIIMFASEKITWFIIDTHNIMIGNLSGTNISCCSNWNWNNQRKCEQTNK